jgi:uncharacterized repeat protein (TIGR01451 family)
MMIKGRVLCFFLKFSLFILSGIVIHLTTVTAAQADTITVCASGCDYTTITDAISAAASGDVIAIGPGTYTQSTNITIDKSLTLQGAGAASTIINGTASAHVIGITNSPVVTITGVTIQNGKSEAGGGILVTSGTLTLNDCIIQNNEGTTLFLAGGGMRISSSASVTMNNCIVRNNLANDLGGGITNCGSLTINHSTLTNNRTNNFGGGAIMLCSATPMVINNSTISGNTGQWGGGVRADNGTRVVLNNTTVTGNTASNEGGAFRGGTVEATNSIIAGNNAPVGPDGQGTLDSGGHNLIQNISGITIMGNTDGNITGQSPMLGSLQNNGGTTPTHALLSGSPAMDAGSCPESTSDQRGFSRPVDLTAAVNAGDGCDIGAYEVGPNVSLVKTVSSTTPEPGDTINYTIIAANNGLLGTTTAFISDTLPAGLTFLGPVSLDPPGAGTVGNAGTLPIIANELSLGAGEVITLTMPVLVDMNLAGGQVVTNSAILGSAEIATTPPAEAAFVVASVPSITVTKTASPKPAMVGQIITYTYRVTNTGNVNLTGLIAMDDRLGPVSFGTTTLEPQQSTSSTLAYPVIEADLPGPLQNTVTVTASSTSGDVGASASEAVTLTYQAGLSVTQEISMASGTAGQPITFTYIISNTGNVSLTDLMATHTRLGQISLDLTTLAPGQETTGTLTYIIADADLPGPLMSTWTVTGTLFNDTKINATTTAPIILSEEQSDHSLYLPLIKKG